VAGDWGPSCSDEEYSSSPNFGSKEATLRLSRTDLVPVLTIMAGGAIGFSLSVGFLAPSRSVEVPVTPVLLYEGVAYIVDWDAATVEPETDAPARVGTVTGQVIDAQTGYGVVAAQVSIAGLDLGAPSNRMGHYSLEDVPAGTYTLVVARIGYRITKVQITVGGGETVEHNFALAHGALLPPTVIVPAKAGTVRGEVLDQ